jgi:O-antigen/teichoic acid export membrane protein
MLVITRLITRVIDLVSLIVLARLLMPADFGLVAIAMTLVLIGEALSDLPISQAVVRLPKVNQDHLDTAFTVSLLRGGTVSALLCLAAWPFAVIYQDMRLVGLVCALGLAPAFRGLCNPNFARFARNLDFRREMLVEIGTKVTSLLVAATVAWTTRSYWAIAAGTVAGPIAMTLLAYAMAPWRPRLTLREWPDFSRFLGWASGGQMLNAISWQVDQLALGRFVARADMGYFAIANTLAFLPFQVVITQVARPLVSALARLQDDPIRLAAAYRIGTAMLVALCLPLMVGMSVLADPIVALALGSKWDAAAGALRWLALATIPALFVAPAGALAMAINRTDTGFRLSGAEFVIRLPMTVFAAAQAGVVGVIIARATATLITSAYAMHLVRSMIGLEIRAQIFASWRSILASIAMALAVRLLWDIHAPDLTPLSTFLNFAVAVCWGAIVYAGTTLLLWHVAGRPAGPEDHALRTISTIIARFAPRPATRAPF